MRKSPQRKRADEIIEQINDLFGDSSVSQEETLGMMEDIEDAANSNVEALRNDIRRKNNQPGTNTDDD